MREVLERRDDVSFEEMKFETEMRFTEHLMAAHGKGFRPTAFFCAHDGLALTVVSELLRLGYRIPEDASVVGFGDYSAAIQISPQLTTVKVHGLEWVLDWFAYLTTGLTSGLHRTCRCVFAPPLILSVALRPALHRARHRSRGLRNNASRNARGVELS